MNLAPKNYAELLEAAKAAHCLSWFRDTKHLMLLIDDTPHDRRTSLSFRVTSGKLEVRTLCGWDAKKRIWGGFCSPQGTITFPDKRGLKALIDWLRGEALKQDEFTPNPQTLHIYRKEEA